MTLEKPCTLVRGLTFLAIHANFLTEKKEEIMSEIPPVRRNWRLLAEVLQTEGHPAILGLLAIESRDGILDAFFRKATEPELVIESRKRFFEDIMHLIK